MRGFDRRRALPFVWVCVVGLVVLLIPSLVLAQTLPAKIEAEDYKAGGEGTGYHDSSGTPDEESCSDTGGGYNIYSISEDEWLAYDVTVPTTGDYTFTFRYKNCSTDSLHVMMGDTNITGSVSLPGTSLVWTDKVVEDVELTVGTYVMKVVFDTGGWNWQDGLNYIDIAFEGSNTAPTVDAGSNDTITWPTDEVNLDSTVSDDSLPASPGTYTVTWTKQSGPGTVTFTNASAEDTTAEFSASGSYVLRLTADDGELTAYDDVTIEVNAAPSVDAGSNAVITWPTDETNLDGTVSDDSLPASPGTYTVTWTKQSGPGTVTFTNANAEDTTAEFSESGTYVLRLTAGDGDTTTYDDVTVEVNAAPSVNAGSDDEITLPSTADLDGTVSDDSLPASPGTYTVTWTKQSGAGTVTFTNANAEDTTAEFSESGTYVLRLTAGDGDTTAYDDVEITVNASSGSPSSVTFSVSSYGTANTPWGIDAADFDDDSDVDVVTANLGDSNASVLLNNGSGTFSAKSDYGAGDSPRSVAVGDFDEDGYADLAVANNGDGDISIILNDGDGTFGTKTDYSTGAGPYFVVVEDFDKDGNLDLAVAKTSGSAVEILMGNGDGTFDSGVSYSANVTSFSIATGYFDSDSYPDLVVGNAFGGNVSVLLNDGDGTFGTYVSYDVDNASYAVATGDFDEDGYDDIVAVNHDTDVASVLLNDGDGTFGANTDYAVGDSPQAVTVADFNWDGHLDIAAANYSDSDVSVLLGAGDGSFGTKTDYAVGSYPHGITAGDFNGDNKTDLATANSGNDTVSILLNTSTGSSNTAPTVNAGSDDVITWPTDEVDLDGTVSDDSLPASPGTYTVTWTKQSGAGTVTFTNANAEDTTAEFSASGSYVLRLTADDGELTAYDDVTIEVNAAPTVDAGSNAVITWPTDEVDLDGTVSDDSLPASPGTYTVTWTKQSGAGTVTFTNVNAEDTTAEFSESGTYVLRLTAGDGDTTAYDEVQITVNSSGGNTAPTVDAGLDDAVNLSSAATLDATVTDDDLPDPPATYTVTWTKQSGPGTVTFGSTSLEDTTATFSETGTYVLRLTADDSDLNAYDEVTIEVVADGVFILPTRIQAEDYHNQSGVSTTATNDVDGNLDLYLISTDAWTAYNVFVPSTGYYTIIVRALSAYTYNGECFRIEIDDVDMTGIIGPTVADTYVDVVVEDVELIAGQHVLKYYEVEGGSWNSRVNWIEAFIPANAPPTVDAGDEQCIAPVTATAALSGTVSDDGRPDPTRAVTVTWTKESGPGTVTFGNADCLDTTATFSAAGTYVLRLTADDSGAQPYDTVVVGVSDRFMLPAKIEAEDYRYGASGLAYNDTTAGNAGGQYRDDDVDIYATSDTGGGYTIRDAVVDEWTAYDVNVPATGTYDFTFRVSSEDSATASLDVLFDGESVTSPSWSSTGGYDVYTDVVMQDVLLTAGDHIMTVVRNNGHWSHGLNWIEVTYRNILPTVDAGSDQTVSWSTNLATLDATVADDGLPTAVTTTWTMQSGPGTVTFGNASLVDTTATFSAKGVYVLRLTADDSHTAIYDEVAITLLADYFVSKQGSDANNGTSWETAFLTVQKGVDALAAGDRLTIGPGEYFESVSREDLGGSDADTVIRAHVPGTAVLRGDVSAPTFTLVEGYQFVYAASFEDEPVTILDHNGLYTFFPKANLAELEFEPGSFYYDADAEMLYISNPDLSAPGQHRYTILTANDHGLELTDPQRVTVDGLAASGFNMGILMITPESCVVRNCVLYMNTGGILMEGPDGPGGEDGGSDNLVEECVAYGNSFAGIARYSADDDAVQNNYLYRNVRENNEHFGIVHYSSMTGSFLMKDNIAWGHNYNYSSKPGDQYEQLENCVGLGYIRITNTNMTHNLIAGGNEYGTNPPSDNILFERETPLDEDFEFADPDNLDFRLQSDSRFRGAAPDSSDSGPYPYEANIYYVSPTGDDQLNNGLSMRNPWLTLERAFRVLKPGDTVYLSEGEYDAETLDGAGDGESPIRILGRSRGTVIISGLQNVTDGAGLVFERLDFDGGVALTDCNDATFKNCTFFGAEVGLDADGVEGLKVTHSLFDDASLSATGSSDVMLSGNVYANDGDPAVCLDSSGAIRYSDYNGYADTTNCWEVNSATWSFASVQQQHHDVYSLAVTPTLTTVAGVPRMEPDPAYASAGPNDTALGIYYEYDVSVKTLDLVGPFVHSVSDTTANIEWWAASPATFSLAWGETVACENEVNSFTTSGRFSTFSLTDLDPDETYYFKIVSADATSADPNLAVLYPTDPPVSFTTDATLAAARTFYVAPDGDDANDGLSRVNALRTICRAADQVGPGDTVMLAEGDYPETVRIRTAGTEDDPITFRCITGEKPTLQLAYLPLSFELVKKPDIRFDGLYFEGQDMWREGFVLQDSPRVQITRCMDTMVVARNSSDLLVKNCVISGGWFAVEIDNSPGSVVENNVIAGTILQDVVASSTVTVRKNIFCESLRGKMHQTLLNLSEDVTESDNCFYIFWPATERLVVNNLALPIYEYQTSSNAIVANPMMPGATGFFQGWSQIETDDFDQCFSTNPELILSDIGLQQTEFDDFEFESGEWPYTSTWAEDFVDDRDAAEAYEAAEEYEDALDAYNDMLDDLPMGDRLKSEIMGRASRCAEMLSDYEEAMDLAEAIPVEVLSMHRRMELMLAQGQYSALVAAFNPTALSQRCFALNFDYPEHEDVMGDLYYYRAIAYTETNDLTLAEADLKIMNDKREELTYASGVLIHDEASLRLGNFYRDELEDDDKALAAYLEVCDRTTWNDGIVDKPVLSGAYESLELATEAACEILRAQDLDEEADDLEDSLAAAQAAAAAALGN